MPVTQKKLVMLTINTEISKRPICSLDKPIFVNTIAMTRKVMNLKVLNTCKPVILLTFLLGVYHIKKDIEITEFLGNNIKENDQNNLKDMEMISSLSPDH